MMRANYGASLCVGRITYVPLCPDHVVLNSIACLTGSPYIESRSTLIVIKINWNPFTPKTVLQWHRFWINIVVIKDTNKFQSGLITKSVLVNGFNNSRGNDDEINEIFLKKINIHPPVGNGLTLSINIQRSLRNRCVSLARNASRSLNQTNTSYAHVDSKIVHSACCIIRLPSSLRLNRLTHLTYNYIFIYICLYP